MDKVLLIDVDGHNFPNLCLMKLSSFYKKQGYATELLILTKKERDLLKLGQQMFFDGYYKIFAACVFQENKEVAKTLQEMGCTVGGSGLSLNNVLPQKIEREMPNYALYNIHDTAYGFLTRGCPRNCPFCIVAKKEGLKSYKAADLKDFWNGQKYIKLLDPNLLASDKHLELLQQLVNSKAYIDFTQGLDVRLTNEENLSLIKKMKIKRLHFAWDNPYDERIKDKFKIVKDFLNLDYSKMKVYVLTNFWSTFEEDLERVYWLRNNGYDPYLMIYDKENASQKLRYLQRYVNNKLIFRTIKSFDEYNPKRG